MKTFLYAKVDADNSFVCVAIMASDSEENEDDDDFEQRVICPRTRKSITGIRPADLTVEPSEIDNSVDEQASVNNASSANATWSSTSE